MLPVEDLIELLPSPLHFGLVLSLEGPRIADGLLPHKLKIVFFFDDFVDFIADVFEFSELVLVEMVGKFVLLENTHTFVLV